MSNAVKREISVTAMSGSQNRLETRGDLTMIGQFNQTILASTLPREDPIRFEVGKPIESFTGREKELDELHKHLQQNTGNNKFTVISQVASISGLGGIGKSEIARMYASLHGRNYDGNVVWINAETYASLSDSFQRLARDYLNIPTISIDGRQKDIKSIVQQVYKYFSDKKSLFIFDNAKKLRTRKNQDDAIYEFLPNYQSNNDYEPYIIITSRNQDWGETIKVLLIDTLTKEEAMGFIRNELNINDKSQEEEICRLAKTLQCFPLALQQAVAYIKYTNKILKASNKKFQIIDYLQRFEKNKRELLDFDFPDDNSNCYAKTTYITWEITLKKIQNSKYGEKTLKIVKIMAYFAPDNISSKIFLEIVKGDQEKLGSVIELAEQYSMVRVEEGILKIHRLVQQVMRLRLRDERNEKVIVRKALKLIIRCLNEKNTDTSQYLPHAITAWNHASNGEDKIFRRKLIKFSSKIIHELIRNARYRESHLYSIRVLELLKHILNIGKLSKVEKEYGLLLEQNNGYNSKILKEVYELTARVLGEKHSSTLLIKFSLALLLNSQGRYDEALEINQEILNIEERMLGKEHPDTLGTRHEIALVLNNQSKYNEAFRMYQEVLNISERVLGNEHPDTLTTRHCIASLLNNQGRYDEALGMYQEVLNISERVLGKEHPSTLTTWHNVALVLNNQGKYDEALEMYQEVLNIKELVLGKEHPDTLTTRHNIASALNNQGRYYEALGMYQEVLNVRECVLGKEHPNTLTTRNCIASVLKNKGKYDEALGMYQEVLNISERVLGKEHPSTLTTWHNVALVLNNQGKYDEALEMYQEVLNIKELVLGKEHPDTLTTRSNIASVLDNQGKYDEALGMYQEVLNIKERVLGNEHPDTIMTKHNIAFVLKNQGKYNEAFKILQ